MKRDLEIVAVAGLRLHYPRNRASLKADRPDLDPDPILDELRAFAAWRRGAELTAFGFPPSASRDGVFTLQYVLKPTRWLLGTCPVANVSRRRRRLWGILCIHDCDYPSPAAGAAPQGDRQVENGSPSGLDCAASGRVWQPGLIARMSSEPGYRKLKWSADHLDAVTRALPCRLALGGCENLGHDVKPQGPPSHTL